MSYSGGCLCGGIRFQIEGKIDEIVFCHCPMCRKAQGSAFAANAPIKAASIRLESGRELLKEFLPSENKARVFCSNSGSPIYSYLKSRPEIVRLRLDTINDIDALSPSNKYLIF